MTDKQTEKIIEIISKVIKIKPKLIDEKSSMKNLLKWDSLAHLQIIKEIEKQFKKEISTSKMSDLNSVSSILKFLKS
jgi:acyl carrier protein